MGKYKKMLESAKQRGVASDDKMWKSIESVEELLDEVEDESIVNKFMRRQHEIIYGRHYDECTAMIDVEKISYTDRDGSRKSGAHWSVSEVDNAMRGMNSSGNITKWDKFVAANTMYADTCKHLDDEQIIKSAYSFFLCDEDWPNKDGKIWDYFSSKEWFETREVY